MKQILAKFLLSISIGLLSVLSSMNIAQSESTEDACKFNQSSSLETILQNRDQAIKYRLQVEGREWNARGYGWHATGQLLRGSPNKSNEFVSHGLFNISPHNRQFTAPSASFVFGSEKSLEFYGYPHRGLGPEHISLLEIRSDFELSNFIGVTKIYDFAKDNPWNEKILKPFLEYGDYAGLVSLKLTDDCADFTTTLIFASNKTPLEAASTLLEELKSEVSITKSNLGQIAPKDQ